MGRVPSLPPGAAAHLRAGSQGSVGSPQIAPGGPQVQQAQQAAMNHNVTAAAMQQIFQSFAANGQTPTNEQVRQIHASLVRQAMQAHAQGQAQGMQGQGQGQPGTPQMVAQQGVPHFARSPSIQSIARSSPNASQGT